MTLELDDKSIEYDREQEVPVFYGDYKIGQFFADFIVDDSVVLELKAACKLDSSHEAQLLNYLNATDFEVG